MGNLQLQANVAGPTFEPYHPWTNLFQPVHIPNKL